MLWSLGPRAGKAATPPRHLAMRRWEAREEELLETTLVSKE